MRGIILVHACTTMGLLADVSLTPTVTDAHSAHTSYLHKTFTTRGLNAIIPTATAAALTAR